jgi:hypothetical protein
MNEPIQLNLFDQVRKDAIWADEPETGWVPMRVLSRQDVINTFGVDIATGNRPRPRGISTDRVFVDGGRRHPSPDAEILHALQQSINQRAIVVPRRHMDYIDAVARLGRGGT